MRNTGQWHHQMVSLRLRIEEKMNWIGAMFSDYWTRFFLFFIMTLMQRGGCFSNNDWCWYSIIMIIKYSSFVSLFFFSLRAFELCEHSMDIEHARATLNVHANRNNNWIHLFSKIIVRLLDCKVSPWWLNSRIRSHTEVLVYIHIFIVLSSFCTWLKMYIDPVDDIVNSITIRGNKRWKHLLKIVQSKWQIIWMKSSFN